jgi:uncharacterized membrane protein YphA (DoxX/SURF4 family)
MSETEKRAVVEPQADMPVNVGTAKKDRLDFVALLARLFVGGLFVYMGIAKAIKPDAFLTLVRQYEMVNVPFLLNSIAAALPWFEIFCGVLLLAGVAVRGTALMVLLMLAPFTLVALKRALTMSATQALPLCAIEFDCGCGNGIVPICPKLIENCLLMFLAVWLLSGRGKQFCLRFSLFGNSGRKASP